MTETATPTTSAASVMAAIDARRPGLKLAKKHSLLFFIQGHHLAHFGRPMFREPITATDRGISISGPAADAGPLTNEGDLNTIGYVVERYGCLSPADLRTLVRMSRPWLRAGKDSRTVDLDALRDWFRRDDETNDPDDERPNRAERAHVAELLAGRM
jgi:uncharacterized phage-associated protein